MSRELTEKKRRNIRGDKAVVNQETIQEPYQDLRTPYTGDTQAVFTEVEGKRVISTHYLLNAFIKNVKNGTHKVESKADSDRSWLSIMGKYAGEILELEGFTKQDYADYIHEHKEPIPNNYLYSFGGTYEPVEFKVTKINKTFGFTRQDTGECCNFTIVKNKDRDGFIYKLQPLDDFNLPEWVGGWLRKDDILNNRTRERLNVS